VRTSRAAPGVARTSRKASPASELLRRMDLEDEAAASTAWPSKYYATRPLEFCANVLGVRLWRFQCEIVETIAVSRKTSIAGGRKVGKDFAVACACLWFWACHPGAKVILYGPKLESIEEIIWPEIRKAWREHGRCVACKAKLAEGESVPLPCAHSAMMVGSIGVGCETGLRATDDRAIFGMVARPGGGGLRGLSGEYLMSVIDEACYVDDEHISTIEGNLAAAHAKLVALTNPVKTSGWAWRSFHTNAADFVRPDGTSACLSCSSLENPNIKDGADIPGLASREWAESCRRAWGERSQAWMTDVLGIWPKAEEGQLIPLDVILGRPQEWLATRHLPVEGRLAIGVDVAGEARTGDRTAITVRRGNRVLCFWTSEELGPGELCTPDRILSQVLIFLGRYRTSKDVDDQRPRVVIDRDGAEGARVYDVFLAHARNNYGMMLVTEFRGSPKPTNPTLAMTYKLNRDLLFGTLLEWVRDGGCWPENQRLRAQLVALRWVDNEAGKQVLIRKDDLREILEGSSPDEMDSLALSCWMMGRKVIELPTAASVPQQPPYEWHEPTDAGADHWGDSILRRR
jgi:hypothetical protein